MKTKPEKLLLFLSSFLAIIGSSANELSLNPIFSKNMVLQRESPIKIWGKGLPGKQVKIQFNSNSTSTIVSEDGKWLATLPQEKAGGPYVVRVSSENQTINLSNVLVGDV